MKYKVSFNLDFKRNKEKGIYIAFEGIDGSGKSTQVKNLAKYLKTKGYKVVTTREPRKTGVIGELVSKILLGKVKFPAVALQYLFSTDRVLNHQELILPALKQGKIVISDRNFWSAVVYGILDKGEKVYDYKLSDQIIIAYSILSMYHQFTIPDYTFYLRIPLKTSLSRLGLKSDKKEIYEDKEKIEKVLGGYEMIFKRFKNEIIAIDGTLPEKEITDKIIKIIEKKL